MQEWDQVLPSNIMSDALDADNALGNRTAAVASGQEPGASTTAYAYDSLSQLVNVDDGPSTADYAYDAVGNRTQHTDATGTTTYATNALNQYTAVGAALTYDAKGNLTSDGARTYAYDSENHLLSAQSPQP